MTFTGSQPVGSIAPPVADVLEPGRSNAARGRAPEHTHNQPPHPELPSEPRSHDQDDVPVGLVEALMRTPDVEPDRLDRARAWLRQHRDDGDDAPSCDELAGCIIQDAVELAVR